MWMATAVSKFVETRSRNSSIPILCPSHSAVVSNKDHLITFPLQESLRVQRRTSGHMGLVFHIYPIIARRCN